LVLNLPKDAYADYQGAAGAALRGGAQASDILIRTSRPTIPYFDEDQRFQFGRSETELEIALSVCDARFFFSCNRDQIRASDQVVARADRDNKHLKIKFQQRGGNHRDAPGGGMIGFVTYAPRISAEFRIPVLNVFSIDGTSSLLWAYALTREARGTLSKIVSAGRPRLMIAELEVVFPHRRIETLSDLAFGPLHTRLDVTLRA
jgi:hypothetical protein